MRKLLVDHMIFQATEESGHLPWDRQGRFRPALYQFVQPAANGHCIVCSLCVLYNLYLRTFGAVGPNARAPYIT